MYTTTSYIFVIRSRPYIFTDTFYKFAVRPYIFTAKSYIFVVRPYIFTTTSCIFAHSFIYFRQLLSPMAGDRGGAVFPWLGLRLISWKW